eukprot:g75776.t1
MHYLPTQHIPLRAMTNSNSYAPPPHTAHLATCHKRQLDPTACVTHDWHAVTSCVLAGTIPRGTLSRFCARANTISTSTAQFLTPSPQAPHNS